MEKKYIISYTIHKGILRYLFIYKIDDSLCSLNLSIIDHDIDKQSNIEEIIYKDLMNTKIAGFSISYLFKDDIKIKNIEWIKL